MNIRGTMDLYKSTKITNLNFSSNTRVGFQTPYAFTKNLTKVVVERMNGSSAINEFTDFLCGEYEYSADQKFKYNWNKCFAVYSNKNCIGLRRHIILFYSYNI